ncbi:hypothetical protein F7725_008017 [Dissostichus mawsoni]|uniref:BACK domain-containing protein n=1 Tax=Dissostichus mawsoni TaxID=36200 RepID=A0A7J5Y5Z1_DISMA|nr:hypothetical protein F7725_008017 [Dissostichus mawsoni]
MLAQGHCCGEPFSGLTRPILKWSSQPYGSKWVHRQAMHFLCEEFSQVVTSDVLYELSKEHLLCAIQSDYLQASEQDILKYVVKWASSSLLRGWQTGPNLLSGTAHSVNKRGVKRRDLDVEELKEILSPLLPFIRTEHILPPNSDVLSDALMCVCTALHLSHCNLHKLSIPFFPSVHS